MIGTRSPIDPDQAFSDLQDLRLGLCASPSALLPVAHGLDELIVDQFEAFVPSDEIRAPSSAQPSIESRVGLGALPPCPRGSMRYLPAAFVAQPLVHRPCLALIAATLEAECRPAAAISSAVAIFLRCEPFRTRNVSSSTARAIGAFVTFVSRIFERGAPLKHGRAGPPSFPEVLGAVHADVIREGR